MFSYHFCFRSLVYIFNVNNSVIIIEKTSFHSCFHKAASIDVVKLAYDRIFFLRKSLEKNSTELWSDGGFSIP